MKKKQKQNTFNHITSVDVAAPDANMCLESNENITTSWFEQS